MPKLITEDSKRGYKPLKLVKHVAIAHSGIYTYTRRELATLNLNSQDVPEEYKDFERFNVYRPVSLFVGTAHLFTNLPVTVEHPDVLVDEYNCRDLMKGFTGNESEIIMEDGEAYVHSTLTLIDKDAIDYYDNKHREVSPGYISRCIWESGEHNGVPYQIKMVSIEDVNHLALTVCGRGGSTACVRDSTEHKIGLLSWAKLTMDSKNIREMLSKVAEDSSFIAPIIESMSDIPDTNSKTLFMSCLDDMKNASTMEPTVIKTAVDKLLQIYDKLVDECSAEYNVGGNMAAEKPEEKTETVDYAPGAVGTAGAGTQKPVENKTDSEKLAELNDDKPAESKDTTVAEKKEEHMSKEETLLSEILSELRAIRTALADKGVSDACDGKEEKTTEKVEEKVEATKDSAVVDSSTDTGISVEDFMADMRR
jgi:hypothetical protein